MTALQIVARYYDAWQTKQGDLTDVPLVRIADHGVPALMVGSPAGGLGRIRNISGNIGQAGAESESLAALWACLRSARQP